MKKKLFTIITAGILLAQYHANGQVITNRSANNYFGQPDNSGLQQDWTRSIGVGYFGSNFTNSLLHVDGNNMILPQNGSINSLGEVFRTDAPNTSGNDTYWRMLHGGAEKFNVRNEYNSNAVDLQTVQNGHLNLFTNSIQRMTIQNNGKVGIGTDRPQQRFEVAGGDINLANDTSFYRIANKPALAQNFLILKAADADSYFKVTVNAKGEINATLITERQLAEL